MSNLAPWQDPIRVVLEARHRATCYAVAATYYPNGEIWNTYTVSCGFCVERVPPKSARQYYRLSMGPRRTTMYLCPSCAEWVEEMRKEFMDAKAAVNTETGTV